MSKNVKCEHLPNGKIRLIRDFGEVPRDFTCDGASIPRLGWRIFGHPYDKVHIKNGVRHDWDYTVGGDEAMRKEADRRYRRGIHADGQPLVLAWCEYFVLRLCGRKHFNYWQNSVRPAKQERKDTMKKLTIIAAVAVALCGCATKSRSFDAKGMYASESGQLAIGKIHVDAIPEGTDSAVIHYSEDTAWISDEKTHYVDVILTGTNSVGSASNIVSSICTAFIAAKTADTGAKAKEAAPEAEVKEAAPETDAK